MHPIRTFSCYVGLLEPDPRRLEGRGGILVELLAVELASPLLHLVQVLLGFRAGPLGLDELPLLLGQRLEEEALQLLAGLARVVGEGRGGGPVALVDDLADGRAPGANVHSGEAVEGIVSLRRRMGEGGWIGPLDGIPPPAQEALDEQALAEVVVVQGEGGEVGTAAAAGRRGLAGGYRRLFAGGRRLFLLLRRRLLGLCVRLGLGLGGLLGRRLGRRLLLAGRRRLLLLGTLELGQRHVVVAGIRRVVLGVNFLLFLLLVHIFLEVVVVPVVKLFLLRGLLLGLRVVGRRSGGGRCCGGLLLLLGGQQGQRHVGIVGIGHLGAASEVYI
mmetsp:Transcript_15565/g.37253  ORF Transcript_15565/g.37253 Transcript_15565/m.37253 type:complete len:330 (+) Transcript_15565:134-1123(+)